MPKKTVSEMAGCEGCPMRKLFPDNTFVAPKIGTGLRLVIAEAPGSEEQDLGEPLVGGAGKWFNAMLPPAGLKRETLTLTNCIQCRPPDNIFPTSSDAREYISQVDGYAAVNQCKKNYVEPLLRARPWTRVDLLGAEALQHIAQKDGGIHKWRGSPIAIPALGDKLISIATLHPAAIMREQTLLPIVIGDLRKNLTPPAEHYTLFPTLEQVQAFKAKEFAFDIETSYDASRQISMVGLCAKATEVMVVPFHGAYIDELKRIFAGATSLIGHNSIQFDLPVLERYGVSISPSATLWDTMLLHHLRFPNLSGYHDLEFVGSQFSAKPAWKHDKGTLELYCARDTDVTLQAFYDLKRLVDAHNLLDIYHDIQVPLAKICHAMEKLGFKVDPTRIEAVRADLTRRMAEEETHLPEHLWSRTITVNKRQPAPAGTLSPKTGKPLKFISVPQEEIISPWASADAVGRYLYDELKLPVQYDIKKGNVSTGKIALEKLFRKTRDRSIEAIRQLRKHASIMNLFAKEELIDQGIQHSHFNVHGTASGRLSSSDPNLQNITESARILYVPHNPGWKIIDVDYSQIENRLTAYLAGDKPRLQRFLDDPSFSEHKYLASLLLGVPYDEVKKSSDNDSPYIKAKKIVHGTNYGEGAKKIALINDLDFKEVKKFQHIWKSAIEETSRWQVRTANEAERIGYLTSPFGRKRWFYTSNKYTESLSFLPQATAADMIFRAMIALMYERIGWPLDAVKRVVKHIEPLPKPARLLSQVHDSLLFECPEENLPQVIGVIKRVMEQPFPELKGFSCPIGIAVGDSWGEAMKYEGKII